MVVHGHGGGHDLEHTVDGLIKNYKNASDTDSVVGSKKELEKIAKAREAYGKKFVKHELIDEKNYNDELNKRAQLLGEYLGFKMEDPNSAGNYMLQMLKNPNDRTELKNALLTGQEDQVMALLLQGHRQHLIDTGINAAGDRILTAENDVAMGAYKGLAKATGGEISRLVGHEGLQRAYGV